MQKGTDIEIPFADQVRLAVEAIPWVTARQYPPPHQYVVQARCPTAEWTLLDAIIADNPDSYLAYFRGYQRPMRYWDFDGRRYWRTSNGNPDGGVTHMLNRCLFEDAEPPRRVDEGAVPISDWEGPPWELNGSPWPDWYVADAGGVYRARADRVRLSVEDGHVVSEVDRRTWRSVEPGLPR